MRRLLILMTSVGLALTLASCGGGGSASKSSTTSASATVAQSACIAGATAATPTGSLTGAPSLATLIRRAGGRPSVSFTFTQRACVGNGSSPTTTLMAASMRLRPTLAATISRVASGQTIEERVIGNTVYVFLPTLAARDGGRPWVAISLASLGAQIGLNVKELLSEIASSNPNGSLKLLASAKGFAPIGATSIDGVPVYGFRGTFDLAHLPASGLSADLVNQLKAGLTRLGASSETVTTYLSAAGHPVRIVNYAATTARGPIVTIEDVRAVNVPVSVAPPPASQTISYAAVRKLTG
jgi:hypothetical protein